MGGEVGGRAGRRAGGVAVGGVRVVGEGGTMLGGGLA